MQASVGTTFLSSAIKRLRYYKSLGERTFEQLEEKDFLFQPNPASNSIAVIIQHLHGNMLSRWTNFLTEDGEKPWRQRDEEFGVISHTKIQLLDKWEEGWACFLGALESLTEADLLKTITIRQEPLIVIDAINRQLSHYPYHVGQIVYIGRMIKDQQWKSLSIEPGKSADYNAGEGIKDPANVNWGKQ
ncbi:DUF1572 family protein [Paraflavitalea sp. CAU 1676]|uniref:DUF1572 family protein n=1 Tax=Paraflavitalea sp. CAU 1676 TaxID=3032598 RepID=UPI0023DB8893|nr:DUF1572 family protein [Paraflavitalea sp. CAU 1676]MDF2190212.1 DUF1572 family protein [Paraflavitalea sp. CAU 1676]